MRSKNNLERELKFPGVELDKLRERLMELEAERVGPGAFEDNWILDRGTELIASGRILRLRTDGARARLTFKGPMRLEGNVKVREEREVGIENAEEAAAALVTVAGILYKGADVSWGAQVLNEGVKAINRADRYDGRPYGVTLEAPKYKVWLPLPTSDLSYLFEQAAKRDWPTSIAAAQSIDSKALRSHAYIAACRNVL